MNDDDRADRVQQGLEIFSRMMRPPTFDVSYPEGTARLTSYMEGLGAELAALGLQSPQELADIQSLYFEGVAAAAPLRDEQFAKLAFLMKYAPDAASIGTAYDQLSDAQRAEFAAITAEDLRREDFLE